MYSLLYRCVFFCLGLLKLIFFDTGSVGFAHFEVDFFVLQQFLRQKGTKPPNFDRTCPAFCQKKTQKTTENYGQPKPPIISSQKIDVFKGYSIG